MSAFILGPNQTKWIAALRSGEFKQATKKLRGEDGCCCLGVGCEVFAFASEFSAGLHRYFYGIERLWDVAPDELIEALALRSAEGEFLGDATLKGRSSLTTANDYGATFAEIADFCEANPEAVFTHSK